MANLSSKVAPSGVATSAQGALADTAVQPNDDVTLGAVTATSFSGDGSSLTGITSMPAGAVIHVAQNTAPTGYIKANGAALSRTTYSDLFSAIGTTFGSGDGSTTFNVPDLRGEFVRGWDDARGVDSGRSFGSAQSDQVGEHDHGFVDGRSYLVPRNVAASGRAFGTGAQDSSVVFDALTGQETRPTNVALLACIKY